MSMENEELQKMKELVARLNEASEAYYNGRAELMSDYQWDAMFDELKKLEENTTAEVRED